jgi:hypothetical protein
MCIRMSRDGASVRACSGQANICRRAGGTCRRHARGRSANIAWRAGVGSTTQRRAAVASRAGCRCRRLVRARGVERSADRAGMASGVWRTCATAAARFPSVRAPAAAGAWFRLGAGGVLRHLPSKKRSPEPRPVVEQGPPIPRDARTTRRRRLMAIRNAGAESSMILITTTTPAGGRTCTWVRPGATDQKLITHPDPAQSPS